MKWLDDRIDKTSRDSSAGSWEVLRGIGGAREVYLESIGVSADCLEAIYNLGIVNVQPLRCQFQGEQRPCSPSTVVAFCPTAVSCISDVQFFCGRLGTAHMS